MKERTPLPLVYIAFLSLALATSCDSKKEEQLGVDNASPASTSGPAHGLTPEQAAKVLVKVGDKRITVGEFAARLADQSPYLRARYQSAEHKREFLDNMVRFEVLAAEAVKRGYEKSPEAQTVRDQKMVQRMMNSLFDEGSQQIVDIKEEEIKAYYEKNRAEYHKPEQVRASHILLKSKAEAQKVLKRVLAAPGNAQLFRELARKHSIDEKTRDKGGDLRFFSRSAEKVPHEPDLPAAVREAAFALEKKGDVYSSAVKTELGFHILQLTDRRQPYDRSLEEARRSIQNRLWRERREQAIDKFVALLRKQATVEEHPELLEKIRVELIPGEPAEADQRPDERPTSRGEPAHPPLPGPVHNR